MDVLDHRQGCRQCSAWWLGREDQPCPEGVALHDEVRAWAVDRDTHPDAARWRR